jgi:hypothetical protein
MRVIYRKIRHARYLHIKRNVEKVWGARYTLGARYLSKNTVNKVTEQVLLLVSHKRLPVNDFIHKEMFMLVNRGTVWQEQHKMWHINFHTFNDLGHVEVKYKNS